MTLLDVYEWLDVLAKLAFNSAEPLHERVGFALWWLDLAESLLAAVTGLGEE